jgi:hypothetical protein
MRHIPQVAMAVLVRAIYGLVCGPPSGGFPAEEPESARLPRIAFPPVPHGPAALARVRVRR